MVVMMVAVLAGARCRRAFIGGLQQRGGIRDRLEQLGKGIRPQHVGRGRTWSWRSLSGIECSERSHRSQKSSDLLFHILLQLTCRRAQYPTVGNAARRKMVPATISHDAMLIVN